MPEPTTTSRGLSLRLVHLPHLRMQAVVATVDAQEVNTPEPKPNFSALAPKMILSTTRMGFDTLGRTYSASFPYPHAKRPRVPGILLVNNHNIYQNAADKFLRVAKIAIEVHADSPTLKIEDILAHQPATK